MATSTTKSTTKTPAKSTPAKSAAKTPAKSTEVPKTPATSLRDTDRPRFNSTVRELKKTVGAPLAHTFAHLAWTTVDTDPTTVDGVLTGNVRRNDAVAWLRSHKVIDKPIPEQVTALVTALREEGADADVIDRIAGHYGVDLI